ncbi:hypothetical protein QMO56_12195 [Roseomonas sp. E05]|uniref:hypothetical protein n=1 Tax=Roseomonas sp. E05 TaxID=3046310 RepID=UPI0024BBCBD4|nr:hypothetical protein [Roseomonas sp. E05]MDJ0388876.1 hypothetical protein [Roseomonas sp. E05]
MRKFLLAAAAMTMIAGTASAADFGANLGAGASGFVGGGFQEGSAHAGGFGNAGATSETYGSVTTQFGTQQSWGVGYQNGSAAVNTQSQFGATGESWGGGHFSGTASGFSGQFAAGLTGFGNGSLFSR